MRHRQLRVDRPLDLALTLGPLRRGPHDRCVRIGASECWRATRTPEGPATLHLVQGGSALDVAGWGPGAAWALDAAPALVGLHDDGAVFRPRDDVVATLHRRLPGLRLGATGQVVEVLVPTVLEQRVTSVEAQRSYARLVERVDEPAPGPAGACGLRIPPDPARLAALPYFAYHHCGIERGRAETLRRVCARADRLDGLATPTGDGAELERVLRTFAGVGPWTAGSVRAIALGDPDAVSVGDCHLPSMVAWALAGERQADDVRMLELLEPYRGQRARVIRLLTAAALFPPRRPRSATSPRSDHERREDAPGGHGGGSVSGVRPPKPVSGQCHHATSASATSQHSK